MPRYTYKCNECGHEYVEIREESPTPYFTNCPCGEAYTEVTE